MPVRLQSPPSSREVPARLSTVQDGAASLAEPLTHGAEGAEQATALLLDVGSYEEEARERRIRLLFLLTPLIIVLGGIFIAADHLYLDSKSYNPFGTIFMSVTMYAGNMLFYLCNPVPTSDRQTNAAVAAARLAPDDPRTLAALLDALPRYPLIKVTTGTLPSADLAQSLTSPLWNIRPSDLLTLTDRRRARLRDAIREAWAQKHDLSPEHADFCAAAIKALAAAGDTAAIPLLKAVIRSKTPTTNRAIVRDAATYYHAALRENAARNTAMDNHLGALLGQFRRRAATSALEALFTGPDRNEARASLVRYVERDVRQLGLRMPVNMLGLRLHYLARISGDARLLPLLLDATLLDGGRMIPGALSDRLRELTPGDGVYLAPRHRRFLRRIVSERLQSGTRSPGRDSLTFAAIHALGIAGDTKAEPLLQCLAHGTELANVPFGWVATEALERVRAARGWQEGLKRGQ